MDHKTESKLKFITDNLLNGNKKDAAKSLRGLSKLETVYLITHTHQFAPGYIGDRNRQIYLEDFIINALSGMYK